MRIVQFQSVAIVASVNGREFEACLSHDSNLNLCGFRAFVSTALGILVPPQLLLASSRSPEQTYHSPRRAAL